MRAVSVALATLISAQVSASPIIYQPGPSGVRDIWTTSEYAFDGVAIRPGGGLNHERLQVGGWGDTYQSLVQFDLSTLPRNVAKVEVVLSSTLTTTDQSAGTTPLFVDAVTSRWDWENFGTGRDRERLWWADRPSYSTLTPTPVDAPPLGGEFRFDITDTYNKWQDGTLQNFGIQIRPHETWNKFVFFHSSEAADRSLTPRLEITKTGPLFIPDLPASPGGLTLERDPGDFDPNRPTVVITHGWQPVEGDWQVSMANAINNLESRIGAVNVIRAYWADANTALARASDLRSATAQVSHVGSQLAQELKGLIGDAAEFAGGLQLIGHSLGSLVNAYASNALANMGVRTDQFTILDRPFGAGIRTDSIFQAVGGDSDSQIFRNLLPAEFVPFVDNYFGLDRSNGIFQSGATGGAFAPDANALDIAIAGARHSDVHGFYIGTVGTDCVLGSQGGGFGCSIGGGGYTFAASMYPWDPRLSSRELVTAELATDTNRWLTVNCELNGIANIFTCNERSPAYLWMTDFTFDPNAQFLTFDFAWLGLGDGDWLTLHFDNVLLYNGSSDGRTLNELYSSGFLPVGDLAGRTGQLLFSLSSVGDANASFSIQNIVTYSNVGAVPEPSSWAMLIAGFGLVGAGLRMRRRRELALTQ